MNLWYNNPRRWMEHTAELRRPDSFPPSIVTGVSKSRTQSKCNILIIYEIKDTGMLFRYILKKKEAILWPSVEICQVFGEFFYHVLELFVYFRFKSPKNFAATRELFPCTVLL
jgi:hypothetical protein